MSIFNFKEREELGRVAQVDTARVLIRVPSSEKLSDARVGRLTALRGRPGEWLISMVERVIRKFYEENAVEEDGTDADEVDNEENVAHLILVGTLRDKEGERANVWTRSLPSVQEIDGRGASFAGSDLESLMGVL